MTTSLPQLGTLPGNSLFGNPEATRTLSGEFAIVAQTGSPGAGPPNFACLARISPSGVAAPIGSNVIHNGPLLNVSSLQSQDVTWNLLGGVTTATLQFTSSLPAAPNSIQVNTFVSLDSSPSPLIRTNFNATLNAISDVAMATLRDGTVVVTWTEVGRDADGAGVFLQRFDNFGETLGATRRLSVNQADDQRDGEVAALANGGYAVAYEEVLGGSTVIRASFFGANGALVLGNVVVAPGGSVQRNPDIASIGTNRVAIAWENETTGDVFVRLYTEAGAPVGAQIRLVHPGAGGREGNVSVKGLTDGTFLVAWTNIDGLAWTTFAQQFTSAGVAIGLPHLVSVTTASSTAQFDLFVNAENEILDLADGGFGVIDVFGRYRFFEQGTDLRDYHQMTAADRFNAYAGDDVIFGSSGNDTIYGGQGLDILYGNGGDDTLVLGGVAPTTVTTALPAAYGGQGSDRLVALNSALLDGGAGNDALIGSVAQQGGLGLTRDVLYGGAGDDFINGRGGLDTLYGGEGNDFLVASGESGGDPTGASPFVEVYGGAGNDRLIVKEAVVGGGIGVPVAGTGFASAILDGGDGADFIRGGNSNDSLSGGTGNDTLIGGGGDNILTGGANSDWFSFRNAAFGNDVVTDFQNGADRFQFVGFGAANFASLVLTTVGANVEIDGPLGAGTIIVLNAAGLIDAGDFVFV